MVWRRVAERQSCSCDLNLCRIQCASVETSEMPRFRLLCCLPLRMMVASHPPDVAFQSARYGTFDCYPAKVRQHSSFSNVVCGLTPCIAGFEGPGCASNRRTHVFFHHNRTQTACLYLGEVASVEQLLPRQDARSLLLRASVPWLQPRKPELKINCR